MLSGYFTSRPALKRYEHSSNIKSKKPNLFFRIIQYLGETMGVMQHHDVTSGTKKRSIITGALSIPPPIIKY
jgi:hypothetical protein